MTKHIFFVSKEKYDKAHEHMKEKYDKAHFC